MTASSPTVSLDDVLDTLAFTLRAIGQHAPRSPEVAADEIKAFFEALARHALVGAGIPEPLGSAEAPAAPAPDWAQPEPEEPTHVVEQLDTADPTAALEAPRDWPAVRHAVVGHLGAQSEDISRTLSDLRDVVWAFVGGLANTLVDDATADADARAALRRLQAAAAGGSTGELKEAALATVAELEAIAESRKARQRDQARRLGEHISRLRGQLDEASREAERDGLTRVANRKLFDRELERAQELCTLVDEPSCLIIVDVDHFKQVNDTFGHPAGDQVLCALADATVRCFPRKSDVVARFGGDEFVVILRAASLEDGERLGQRLLEQVREQSLVSTTNGPIQFTVSIGVAASERLEQTPDWLDRADRALYEAKSLGRDRMVVERGPLANAA